jgi:D-alanyl-lipoteichoic acid acyltransferase DltB (MBOAT superfamily)
MSDQVIDIARARFWLVFLLAVVILTPLTGARLRKWTWAGANLVFLGQFLYRGQFIAVIGALLITYGALKAIERRFGWRILTLGLGGGVLGLFLLHKLPVLSSEAGFGAINPVLVVLGFSYVALRLVEVLRAVLEGQYPAPDLPSTINYLLPFHMLAAGPIQSYDEFAKQLPVAPPLTTEEVLTAAERITRGLVKKFILAYTLQKLFLTGFRAHGLYLLFEAQVFFIWLYLDFSALSDLAVGMGKLLGVATPENFNQPYLARNLIDFWERWHISLSQFIRRNLFIPLQLALMRRSGGRHPLWCASIAFTVSFVCCGLWHGVGLGFLIWGLLHAGGLVVNNLYRFYLTQRLGGKGVKEYLKDKRTRIAATVVTFEFAAFSLMAAVYPWQELW